MKRDSDRCTRKTFRINTTDNYLIVIGGFATNTKLAEKQRNETCSVVNDQSKISVNKNARK